jgi:arabinan endo-1,5-alpha-L-arabinosidase
MATATGGAPLGGAMAGAGVAGVAGVANTGGAGGAGMMALDASLPVAGGDADVEADSGAPMDAGLDDDRCDIASLDPAQPPTSLMLSGALGTHDPVVIAAHGQYYEFNTGDRIPTKTSTDLRSWQDAPRAFDAKPAWIAQRVSGVQDLWAPDISFFGGLYHLYYSASTFGSNRSCIGHATRAALNAGSWSDQGATICSTDSDDWNAIDPNVVVDQEGTPWLSFGSFWSGIKLIELDEAGARANDDLHSLAGRGGGAIEAPFIVRRCGYYYLFVSFDRCCSGASSTYNIRVGRSQAVTGPYVDRDGVEMLDSGGTRIVSGAGRWNGPGHNAVIFTDTGAFNIYHSYDGNRGGAATLRISELAWDAQAWPVSAGP